MTLIDDENTISFDEIAKELNISKATIRNWIKLGLITQCGKNLVERLQFNRFRSEKIGTQKLTARANKTQMACQDLQKLEIPNLEVLFSLSADELETLAQNYEADIANCQRNIKGVYYTPQFIAKDILQRINEPQNMVFLDPCCGTGNFLLAAIDAGFSPANVYGYDNDEVAIIIAKARVYKKTGLKIDNIQCTDYLNNSVSSPIQPDCVFTNPPWGVKYNSKEKTALTKKYDLPKSSDSCAIFAAAILEKLKPNGTVGLLLPEAFFNISSYRKIRQRLLNSKIMSIKNHGRAFDGLLTKAQEIVFEKRLSNNSQKVLCDFDGENYWREQSDFANNPNQIFNFYCDDIDAKIIAHLFRHPHQTLKNKAKWALGIVTGGNNTHLLKAPIDGAVPIFKGNDITGEGFKDPTNWIAPDFDKFQQSAPRDLYEAPEKIAYRFISSQLCFAYDNEKRLFLNSANMLIPSNELGISAANLTKLLNTSLLRWLFAKIFNTPKILRGDLETLPLFVEQFKAANFVENEGFYDSLGILEHLNRINPHPSAPAQRPSR